MNLNRYLRDKVVVVTGSSRGLGRETVRLALESGARVVLNGRDPEALERTRVQLGGGDRLLAVAADLAHPEEAEYLVAAVLAAWGRLDALVNNAGLSMRGAFAQLSNETAQALVDANLLSSVWTTRAALAALRQTRGRAVFVSSLAGLRGFPGVSVYSAVKMALTALAQSLGAEESGHGVSFGVVHLPFTENDPEKTVLGADGKPFRHERPWAFTQRQAARTVLEALVRGRRRTVVTAQGRLLAWAQAWLPWWVDRIVAGSQGRIHRIEEKQP
jgi:NAD(P)-dependent dehydrogenase (short-subunit alcohol dehydrogenase family)